MASLEAVPVHSSGKLDRSSELFIVQTAFMTVAGVCVLTRAYVKTFLVKKHLLDDYLLYAAMVGYLVYGSIVIDGSHNGGGIGKHPSIITTDGAARGLRTWYLTMVLYPSFTLAARASVGVLLLRLTIDRRLIWIVRINFMVNCLASIVLFFALLFQCSPPRYFWTQVYGETGSCYDRRIVTDSVTAYSVLCALSDWCLGLLPIAILWKVQINLRTKIVIASLLSMGIVAGIALIVRVTYMTRLQPGLRFLYEATDVAIWSVLEAGLGIIAASFATFRPLFRRWGFGWGSKKGDSHAFSQRQLARFPSAGGPEIGGLEHAFDRMHEESKQGSEHELTLQKAYCGGGRRFGHRPSI